MSAFPEAPPNLKAIQPYLKIASEHDARDFVVAYWARVYSLQNAIKLAKQPDEKQFLLQLMDWLENVKKANKDNDLITIDTVAQAHLENQAHKLFAYADRQDRAGNFDKNVIKAFYTSAMLYDVITTFGELSDEASQCKKYAKWKATYIHNCLKNGETPHAGPLNNESEDELAPNMDTSGGNFGWNMPSTSQNVPSSPPEQQQPMIPTTPKPQPSNDASTFNPMSLPDPPKDPEPKHPGGFIPYQPNPAESANYYDTPEPVSTSSRTSEEIAKAQKYCKFASSALNYEDVPTAMGYLQKCIQILQTGKE